MASPPKVVSIHRANRATLPIFANSDRSKRPITPTAAQPLVISISELQAFLRCRVRWHWGYRCGFQRKKRSDALALGTLVHAMLEAWYTVPHAKRTVKAMQRVARKIVKGALEAQLSTEQRALAEAMCIGYAEWAQDEDASIGLTECTPEGEFSYSLVEGDPSIVVHGRIDNTFKPGNLRGTRAMQEFKTRSQFRNEPVDLNSQLSVYLWAMRRKYPNAKRYVAYWTCLRKQAPGPKVRAALFSREPVERSDDEVEQWARDTRRVIADICDAAIYPNPSDACAYDCDFRTPCMLRGNRADVRHVLSTEYERRS